MSDHSISIVPRISSFPNKEIKIREILDWLISRDIIKSSVSDCVLGSSNGHAVSFGAKNVTHFPDDLPFNLITNGLEVVVERQIFHAGEGGINTLICPNCNENIAEDDWDFFNEWASKESDNITCPKCHKAADIHLFKFDPIWGFSDLGFTFWNWLELTEEFVQEFKFRLGTEISLVNTHI